MRSLLRPQRSAALELLDTPEAVLDELAANLRDIRLLNRWFGGTAVVRRHVRGACRGRRATSSRSLSLLDVATGSGDIPAALTRWGQRNGILISATGLDCSAAVLSEASRVTGGSVRLVLGDARALPWPADSFDIVTCSLALHHFDPEAAVQVLREMARVARRIVIVTDLRRSRLSYLATWLVTRVVARNRLTRHDGPISVMRAYTAGELYVLAFRAGLHTARIRRHLFFRLALIWPVVSHHDRPV